ncbi:MAG: hypothetical protein ACJAYO_002063 [Thalassolituus oleivorans]|jgi:hypothetical protein
MEIEPHFVRAQFMRYARYCRSASYARQAPRLTTFTTHAFDRLAGYTLGITRDGALL